MKQYVENTTGHMIYVGGRSIAPGEGREVDVPEAPVADAPADEPDTDAPLRELLAGNVEAVKGSLEGLSAETLDRLQALEQEAKKPRVGVLTALADARLAIADAKLTSDPL